MGKARQQREKLYQEEERRVSFEQRDQSGALFKNDKKGVEKRPDYQGNCMVNGVKMDMSAWIKKTRNGDAFMSISFQEPYKKEQPSFEQAAHDVNLDDDVPF